MMLMLSWPHPALLPNCSPYTSRMCPAEVMFGCRTLVYPQNWSPWPSQPSKPSQPSQPSPPSQAYERLGVTYSREEASDSFESLNCHPESVGCFDPRRVRNASGTLRLRSYECSLFDCYRVIVVEIGVQIVVAPGLISTKWKGILSILSILKFKFAFSQLCSVLWLEIYSIKLFSYLCGIFKLGIVFPKGYSLVYYIVL